MRRPVRAYPSLLGGTALIYAVIALVPIFPAFALLGDAPEGRLEGITEEMRENLRPPVQDEAREAIRKTSAGIIDQADDDYEEYADSLSFGSLAVLVGLFLVYALFAQLRLLLRYLRRIDASPRGNLAFVPLAAAILSAVLTGAFIAIKVDGFDLPGPLKISIPNWWYVAATLAISLTAALSAVTLQGSRLIAWNFMQVEWAKALDEELKRAKKLGLSADIALNFALEAHPRPIKERMAGGRI